VIAANSLVLTDVPDNMTVIGVPARIRIPGGRPKRFKWSTVKPQNGKEQPAQPTNGNKTSQQLPEPATKAQ
jgi:serine acetyltransferase